LFSGIGGFHKGFEQAGFTFDWVGFSEIDKYASAVYRHRYKNAEELGDIKLIQPGRDLPDHINILCGGFPCQAFSVAGKRKGFDDTRGTLFFEIARLLRHYRETESPIDYFVLENVKGLLSHDNGRTFATIYGVLTDLDYTVECQLLNTRWFLPQNRERIYLVGHLGNRSGHKVFPIGEDDKKTYELQGQSTNTITSRYEGCGNGSYVIESELDAQKGLNQIGTIGKDSEATRVYDTTCARTIKNGGGMGAKTGLYEVRGGLQKNASTMENCSTALTEAMGKGGGHTPLLIPEATKKGYAEAEEGDSINLSVPNSKTRRGRVGKGEAQTLDTGMQQYTIQPVLTPNRAEKGQNGRRFKEAGEPAFTLNTQDQHGVMIERSQIRRLTPVECCRLQGFPDDWNEYGEFDGEVKPMSDTQRYKQCGNAVTVNVVQAVAERIEEIK
jgi:DNA (cytosine-5)-methyltransferase 1